MRTSNYSVIDRRINFCDVANITGNENVDTFHFDFDSEWNVFNYKYLVLFVGTKSYIDLLDSNNNVVLRSVAYDRDDVTFGVIGKNVPIEEGEIEEGEEIVPTSPTLSSNIVWLETIPSAFGQIKTVDGLPDKTVWELYTEEMLALLAQGQITLEECQEILTSVQNIQTLIEQIQTDVGNDKTAVEGLKAQIEVEIAEVNAKILAFDSNYAQKLQAFNDNFTEKLNTFNTNYTDKLGTFNTNATQKTNDYNSNATNKTNTFDQNASNKTIDFNVNATSKTGTFNQNASDKTDTFNQNAQDKLNAVTQAGETGVTNIETAEDTAIEHIQVEATSYDDRLDALEILETNFDPNTPTPSDNITITDSLNARVKFSPIGKTRQNSYSGKNLFDEQWTGSVSTNFIPVTAGESYYYSEQGAGEGMNYRFYQNTTDTEYSQTNKGANVAYIPESNGYVKLYKTNTTKTECQLEKGTGVTTYEPYTNLQPSPSPAYPQPINNVEGDVVNNSSNKNWLPKDITWAYGYVNASGVFVNDATHKNAFSDYLYIPAGTYTISYEIATAVIAIAFYDKNKTFIDRDQSLYPSLPSKVKTFTVSQDGYIRISHYDDSGNQDKDKINEEDMQIEAGSTQTTYIQHQGKTIIFPLSQGQKMYEGDYLADDGIHHVRKQVDMGNIDWIYSSTYNYFYINLSEIKVQSGGTFTGKSTAYTPTSTTYSESAWGTKPSGVIGMRNNTHNLCVKDTRYTNVSDFTTAVTGQAVEYELGQEEIESYTEAQQTAWNNLKKMETYKNITHFYVTSDNLNPDIDVTYLVDPLASIKARLDLLEE